MTKLLVVTLASAVAGVSLWGWGRTATRVARTAGLPAALTIAVGLAALLFVGGILNLLHLARAMTLDAVLGLGVALAAWHLRETASFRRRPGREALIALVPLLVAAWFVGCYLLPQSALNIHDDLEKYLAHPVKMLAEGTLGTNPMNSLGAETLGGQAFLQGFVLAHLPPAYVGAVDIFFCLLVCLALAGFILPARPWALGAVLAQVAVLVINPQLVNISATYSAVALVMGAMLVAAFPAGPDRPEPSAPLLGLFYAGLVLLKTTLALFVGFHLLCLAVPGLLLHRLRPGWLARVPAWTLLFLTPWLAVHASLYLGPRPPAIAVPPGGTAESLEFWSLRPLVYTGTTLHYTALALIGLVTGILLLVLIRRGWLEKSTAALAAVAAGLAAAAYYVSLGAGLGPRFSGPDAALRYSIPVLVAVVPVLIRLSESLGGHPRLPRLLPAALAGLCLLPVLAFLPSTRFRLAQYTEHRTILAFVPWLNATDRQAYLEYNRLSLDPAGAVRSRLLAIQEKVPAGESIGVWVMTSSWFDFQRNRILPAEPVGLSMRWSRRPAGLRYFILEYSGFAVRPLADYRDFLGSRIPINRLVGSHTLAFIEQLMSEVSTGRAQLLYRDSNYLLVRLPDSGQ